MFDTVQDDFNFAQLFIENRFVGYDRVGDANQLALAITSRLLDPTPAPSGCGWASGSCFYFSDQQVTLAAAPQKAGSSDFLLGVEGRLSDTWALTGLMQYNFGTSDFDRFNAGVRYTPGPAAGAVRRLPLFEGTRRPDRRSVGAESDLHVRHSGRSPTTGLRRRVELLDSGPQDAGGRRRPGVQWRVLGRAGGGPAVDHDIRSRRPVRFSSSSS